MGLINDRLKTIHVKRDSRGFKVGNASNLNELPQLFDSVEKPFALLLAMDGTRYPDEQIVAAAHAVALRGLVYLCAWGPDCERVHDLFDQGVRSVEEANERRYQNCIMTTWHDKEPLTEASWFLKYSAWPEDDSIASHFDCIGVSIANHIWLESIKNTLIKT